MEQCCWIVDSGTIRNTDVRDDYEILPSSKSGPYPQESVSWEHPCLRVLDHGEGVGQKNSTCLHLRPFKLISVSKEISNYKS